MKFVCCGPLPDEPLIDVNQQQQSETLVLSLEGRTRPVPWWESRGRISRYENNQGFQDPVDPGYDFDFPFFAQINTLRREAEWINAFHIGKWSTSTIGLEYRHEEGENKGTFSARTHTYSVFFEQQLRFFERLFITGGVRVDDHSTFGTQVTRPRLGGLLHQGDRHAAPGRRRVGLPCPHPQRPLLPGLLQLVTRARDEPVVGGRASTRRFWSERIRLGVTTFYNKFDNLIRFVPITTFPFTAAVNIARARTTGVEFTGEVDLLRNLVATVNYTYTDSRGPHHGPLASPRAAASLEHRRHLGADPAAPALHADPHRLGPVRVRGRRASTPATRASTSAGRSGSSIATVCCRRSTSPRR